MPSAIGLQKCQPGRQVICLAGDGGFAMLMGELLKIVQENLPIKIVVYDNGKLGFCRYRAEGCGLYPGVHGPEEPRLRRCGKGSRALGTQRFQSRRTVPAIASQERLTIGYLSRLLRLPSLAPDIVRAIINGKHPLELSAKRLMRLALKLPSDWPAQRKLLGFQEA
jgi:thiamine pyrophosphate-dependent enzyme